MTCLFGKKELESYGFDITKADKIFDLLLSEGLIKLKPYHKIPSEDELKNMKYCKWHNTTSDGVMFDIMTLGETPSMLMNSAKVVVYGSGG